MDTASPSPLWFALFPLAFAALWLAVVYLLGAMGGWHALARRYAGSSRAPVKTIAWGSGALRWIGLPVNYGGSLNLAVSAEGLELKPVLLFAFGSPPLLIPWNEFVECRGYRVLGMFRRFRLVTAEPRVHITLMGRAAHEVEAAFAVYSPRRSVRASPG